MKHPKTIFLSLFFSTVFAIIGTSEYCMGQSLPQMSVPKLDWSPTPYKATPYTPQTADPSILERSLQQQENRRNKAYEKLNELIGLLAKTSEKLNPNEETQKWFYKYAESLISSVATEIEAGNYQSAIRFANENIHKVQTNPRILNNMRR